MPQIERSEIGQTTTLDLTGLEPETRRAVPRRQFEERPSDPTIRVDPFATALVTHPLDVFDPTKILHR